MNTSSEAEHSSEEKNSKTEFLSEQGTAGEFQILPSLFPVWQSADALMQQIFALSPPPFCTLCGAIGTGGNVWILSMANRIMACPGQDTKNLNS